MEENTFDFLNDFESITYSPLPEFFEKEVSQEPEPYIEIMQNGKRIYQCAHSDCGKTFKYKSEANRHLIIHKKGKPYSCSVLGCNRSFKRQETLEEHMRVHGNELPFLCDEIGCGKRLASKPALRYHKLRHKNTREYRCDIEGCNRSFLTMSHLKQHQTSGLHCDKSASDISEKTSCKRFKSQSETDFSEVPLTPAESMWEVKSQYKDGSSSEDCMQEMYEMLQNTLAENQLLKQRLHENQETNQNSFEHVEPVSFSETVEPSSSFDKFELAILEFLNETDKNNF